MTEVGVKKKHHEHNVFPGGEPTKVKCNYIWANVITFAQM